jgi:hypothetical protein
LGLYLDSDPRFEPSDLIERGHRLGRPHSGLEEPAPDPDLQPITELVYHYNVGNRCLLTSFYTMDSTPVFSLISTAVKITNIRLAQRTGNHAWLSAAAAVQIGMVVYASSLP